MVYKWLDNALDYGLKEYEFWDMTLAELIRELSSKKRVLKEQQRERAVFDYALANLIGRSVSRIYNSANTMPDISETYPSLFNAEEIEEKKIAKKQELSALRFKQFAQSYNKKYREAQKD